MIETFDEDGNLIDAEPIEQPVLLSETTAQQLVNRLMQGHAMLIHGDRLLSQGLAFFDPENTVNLPILGDIPKGFVLIGSIAAAISGLYWLQAQDNG